jgi:uncharacterized protein (TIGR03067 family)
MLIIPKGRLAMTSRWVLAFAVALGFAANLGAVADRPVKKSRRNPVQEEQARLEGSWTYVGGNVNHVTIKAGVYTVTTPQGQVVLSAGMIIDPTRQPKWLNMQYTTGFYKGQTLMGIYELKGDNLRLSIDTSGKVRPAAFGVGPVTTLVRQKQVK